MIHISYVSVEGGGKISVHGLRGGADFQRADVEGGQDFGAPGSENSSAPLVAVNNERSLKNYQTIAGANVWVFLS